MSCDSCDCLQGRPYDGKTDIWAIGCILYELCSLKKAFDAGNLGAITVKVMRLGQCPDVTTKPRFKSNPSNSQSPFIMFLWRDFGQAHHQHVINHHPVPYAAQSKDLANLCQYKPAGLL